MDIARKIATKDIIKKLINSEDYRIVTQNEINSKFLDYCINFFKKVVDAKIKNKNINIDWYRDNFVMNNDEEPANRAIYAGINKKTISNMFNSGKKEIVVSAAKDNYDTLVSSIETLLENHDGLDMELALKFNGVSVQLNLNESLIVINSLAVKRAAIRGGAYSSTGKNVEEPLMITLCELFSVPKHNYSSHISGGGQSSYGDFEREIDFFLTANKKNYKCEVKLMGKGNPESADAFIARESNIFIADKLSEKNKQQFKAKGCYWIELRAPNGFLQFEHILKELGIKYKKPNIKFINKQIDDILTKLLP